MVFYDIEGNIIAECEIKDDTCYQGEQISYNKDGSINERQKYEKGNKIE